MMTKVAKQFIQCVETLQYKFAETLKNQWTKVTQRRKDKTSFNCSLDKSEVKCEENKTNELNKDKKPFHHRENLLHFCVLSDLFIFLATICWMEFSQSVFFHKNQISLSVLYQISPLALFEHNCDSYFTYIWILLFNLSTVTALVIIVLCIYAVHQTSFEPRCIIFLVITLVAFVTVSTFPIVAFISFFKISLFVLASLAESNMNIMPAIYSKQLSLSSLNNLNNQNSDTFYQELYAFLHLNSNNSTGIIHKTTNKLKNMCHTVCTLILIPFFAFFDCGSFKGIPKLDVKSDKTVQHDEYEIRIGIANKVLAQHYAKSFWIPYHSKSAAQKLLKIPAAKCTINYIRNLRGYTISNVVSSISTSFNKEFKFWNNNNGNGSLCLHDKILEIQYLIILFMFVPLQGIFILYGLMYPYCILYQICNDLYSHHFLQNVVINNEIIKILLESITVSPPFHSIWYSIYTLFSHWFFISFVICVVIHFILLCSVLRKLWHLMDVFLMCLNVLIIHDNSILDPRLVYEMRKMRENVTATKIRNQKLKELFGRFQLDNLLIEFMGDTHVCE